jgi:hypothetical protein
MVSPEWPGSRGFSELAYDFAEDSC